MFLAEMLDRIPHWVGFKHRYPVLVREPRLFIDGGGGDAVTAPAQTGQRVGKRGTRQVRVVHKGGHFVLRWDSYTKKCIYKRFVKNSLGLKLYFKQDSKV